MSHLSQEGSPTVGQIVKILRGRDQGKYAVITGIIDDRIVLIADGDKRKFDSPKRKNLLHLQLFEKVSDEVVSSLKETGRVTNGKLRFVLNQFSENMQFDAHEKGE